MIIQPGGGNIRMPEPGLHLGDVRAMIERVGGPGRPQRMRTLGTAEIHVFLGHRDKKP